MNRNVGLSALLFVAAAFCSACPAHGQYYYREGAYNPYNGASATAGRAYNPYTGASAQGSSRYNPYTGRTVSEGSALQSVHRTVGGHSLGIQSLYRPKHFLLCLSAPLVSDGVMSFRMWGQVPSPARSVGCYPTMVPDAFLG